MNVITFDQMVAQTAAQINELMPWDVAEKIANKESLLLLDVREADEFNSMHIAGSINVPRGILEAASEPGYDETHPQLVTARSHQVVVICRSGKRSCMATYSLQQLGFEHAYSLKTGLRGWNDFDQPLVDSAAKVVDGDTAEAFLAAKAD